MTVEDERKCHRKQRLGTIKFGKCFCLDDNYYMAIDQYFPSGVLTIVNVLTGKPSRVSVETMVVPLNGKIVFTE